MRKGILFAIIFVGIFIMSYNGYGQKRVTAQIRGKDTIPIMELKPASVYGVRRFKDDEDAKRFKRLVYNVKKVYPYAKKAGDNYVKYLEMMEEQKRRGKQLKTMAPIEKQLKKEYEDQLKSLTYTQGRLLIKLIDRETERSSYELIKTFRGGFKAFWWQTFAGAFNMSLKTKYDPKGVDWEIEMIVKMIENGEIKLDK